MMGAEMEVWADSLILMSNFDKKRNLWLMVLFI